MDPQEPLLDDLSSGDNTKQTNALTRLMQLSANGTRDISIYFNPVVQYCLVPNDHKLKLLAYRILKRCTLIDSEWENKVLPHITRDCANEDQNLAIASIELIPHISASTVLVDFIGKMAFLPSVSHPAPAVRRAAVEILSLLLLQKKGLLQAKPLVTSLWSCIITRLLDDVSPAVYQAAFRAVSNLFDAVDNLSPIDKIDSFGDGLHETRAYLLQKAANDVKNQLVPHFDLLLKRIEFLELPYRAPAVNVLTCLVKEIPKDPLLQSTKNSTTLYPLVAAGAVVPSFVESHLLPFLTHADDGLAFTCGKAILRIWAQSETYHKDWAVAATLGLVGILRRESIAISPNTVITEILRVLHLIPESQLIPCTLKLITSISDFTESLKRQRNLLQIFDLLVKKDLASEGKIFAALFKDPWLHSVWTTDAPFREELLSIMVTKYSQARSRYLDTKGKSKFSGNERVSYLISSLKFVQLCNDTLKWQTGGRTHAVERYVKFIDWLLEHVKHLPKAEEFEQIWTLQAQTMRNLIGNMKIIVSDGICLQVIFIVCKYSSELEAQEEQSIISTLQHRFLLLGEPASQVQKDLAATAAKTGALMDLSVLHVPETPHMQGVLEILHILGLRFPNMAATVQKILDDIATIFRTNEPLVRKVKSLQQKITAQKNKLNLIAFDTTSTDFSFVPPIEYLDTLNTFESPHDRFALDYKKSTTPSKPTQNKLSKIHCHKKILSGSSDPFFIEASHIMRPDIYTIIFRVRILNQMAFAYSNLQVSVGVCGALQFNENSDSIQTVNKLNSQEKIDLEFPILVTNFETGSATVNLTFPSPSPGDATLDADTSLDYEDYGKNYTVTTVVSDVYEFEVGEFLHPTEYLPSEFLSEWNRFPAGFVLDVIFDLDQLSSLFERLALSSSSFHQVLQWSYSEHYFQLAYSSMTWFEDQLCFTLIGQQTPPSESGKKQISTRFGFRASDPSVLSIFHRQVERWLDSWAGVGKYSLVTDPDASIFCTTSDEAVVKSGDQETYDAEEEMLQKWQKARYTRAPPIIPVLTPNGTRPATPPAPAPAPATSTPPPQPAPVAEEADFL